MELREFTAEEKIKYREEMLEMMRQADNDFVPPLSARTSTLQKDLASYESVSNGIELYFEEMSKQIILGAFEDDFLLAFLSYRKDYTNDVIKEDKLPNIYFSTLVAKPEAKGKRIGYQLFGHAYHTLYPECHAFTRTWSTNGAQIHMLPQMGFREIKRIVNDRGEGIDTVYYEKTREK